MMKQSTALVLTCVFAAACGGSNNEAQSAADVSDAEFEAALNTPPSKTNVADQNATQLTVDTALMKECGLTEAKLYFPYDSAEVKGDGSNQVQPMADCLVSGNLRDREVVVVGHTDPRGTAEYNEELGKSRAEAIADLLIAAGVPREKLTVRSAGERAASDDQDSWPWDRRVEVAIVTE